MPPSISISLKLGGGYLGDFKSGVVMYSGIDRKYGLAIVNSEVPLHRTRSAAMVGEIHRHGSPDMRPLLAGNGNFDRVCTSNHEEGIGGRLSLL